MGAPHTACRQCSWYIRNHTYDGPIGYGGCFKKKSWTCANQTACKDDFEPGTPCLSEREAELKWQVRELRAFTERVANWRNIIWDEIHTHEFFLNELGKAAEDILKEIDNDR